MQKLRLPGKGTAPKTGADDPVDLYYRPLTRTLYRGRLRLALRLLGERRHRSLLEVGYGSGVFLPELAGHTDRLVGVDVHGEAGRVSAAMRALGVEVELVRGSIHGLPFASGTFEAVVCVSVLEHVADLGSALSEIRRVLAPDGVAVLGFPVRNALTDAFFRLNGYEPRELHPSDHREILEAARRTRGLGVLRVARFPAALPLALAGYAGCLLQAV